jgi:general secretion pathway protein F
MPIDQSLDSVALQTGSANFSNVIKQVSSKVKSGFKLSESLSEHPKVFDNLFCSLVKAGETSGELGYILNKTSDFLEGRAKMSQEILGALTYPIILFLVSIGVIGLLMVFVVPGVVSQFSGLNQELPLITKIFIALSNALSSYIFYSFLVLIGFGLVILSRIYGLKKIKRSSDKFFLKIPIIKNFLLDADLSRYTSSLSMLRSGGVSIINALEISAETISNLYLKDQLKKISDKVKEGESITSSLTSIPEIPPMVIHMIDNGEKSGKLEEMLEKVSEYLESRFESSTKIAMNMLEPMVVIFLGLFVALIVLAILLPLVQLNTLSSSL